MSGGVLTEEELEAMEGIVGEGVAGKLMRTAASYYDTDTSASEWGIAVTDDGHFNIVSEEGTIDYSKLPADVQTWINTFKNDDEQLDYKNLKVEDYISWAEAQNAVLAGQA